MPYTDWGPMVDVVGFCFLNLAQDYKPPQDLLDWLAAGSAPIYVGFGSLVMYLPSTQRSRSLNNSICILREVTSNCIKIMPL